MNDHVCTCGWARGVHTFADHPRHLMEAALRHGAMFCLACGSADVDTDILPGFIDCNVCGVAVARPEVQP